MLCNMGKNADKKVWRKYGGDANHINAIVSKRQRLQNSLIENQGGAEHVHRRHLSSIVGAKPKQRGRITAPTNPFCGCTISNFGDFYFIAVNRKQAAIREALKCIAPIRGGGVFNRNGIVGVALPTVGNENLIRSLLVTWGV